MTQTIAVPARPHVAARAALTRRDFFDETLERLRPKLPEALRAYRARPGAFVLKLDYGNERVHFEVAPDGGRGLLEVGLHFEDGPISTTAYLAFFDRHIVELKHDLGPGLELERWTASWGRLFELHPLRRLDQAEAGRVAARFAALIVAVQPLVAAANVPPERSVEPAATRGPWRKWRRGRG